MPDGRTELTFSEGQKIVTDLYIPRTGLIPKLFLHPAQPPQCERFCSHRRVLASQGYNRYMGCGRCLECAEATIGKHSEAVGTRCEEYWAVDEGQGAGAFSDGRRRSVPKIWF